MNMLFRIAYITNEPINDFIGVGHQCNGIAIKNWHGSKTLGQGNCRRTLSPQLGVNDIRMLIKLSLKMT